ncbi:hypothetical protein T09_12757 [Trichinella sp. T9]|nr:hypothetical protein T09_12757 [Trichinella sp. T9]
MWISMDRWMNASISSDSIIKTKCKRELSKLSSKQKLSNAGYVRQIKEEKRSIRSMVKTPVTGRKCSKQQYMC